MTCNHLGLYVLVALVLNGQVLGTIKCKSGKKVYKAVGCEKDELRSM